jgi:hypothetical protein
MEDAKAIEAKRVRKNFTPEQKARLKEIGDKTGYRPSPQEVAELAEEFGVTKEKIVVHYSSRRSDIKRNRIKSLNSPDSSDSKPPKSGEDDPWTESDSESEPEKGI